MIYLGACCTSPGFSTEVLHIYLALGLHAGESHPDEDEFLDVEKHSLTELSEKVMSGEIDDGKIPEAETGLSLSGRKEINIVANSGFLW